MASVARTYARAFADVVIAARLDAVRATADLQAIADLMAASVDLRRIWENPAVEAAQKRNILDVIAQRDGISMQVRNLVAVLIDHRRIHFLPAIIQQLQKELDDRLGFAEAEIITVRVLDDAEKRSLESEVEKVTGKKVRAHYAQDASLLGGAMVRVGSTIYDGSIAGQLQKIKEALSS